MAQMACTLQAFCQGRLALSLGKGIARFLEKAGIDQRDNALEECVTIMRHLISGDRFSLNGQVFKLDGIRLRTDPPEKKIPLYLAAIGDPGWGRAAKIADGVSTFWNGKIKETRDRHLGRNTLPVAVLIPFSISRADFFPSQVQSCDLLIERVNDLDAEGFDEVIIAYSDLNDLESVTSRFSEIGLL
jgi:alkanesulfonate monooxygenase SsuD/methylene tetrahydromethanopterin reductase-like flavin-dependent oxidoreductase (luciferase family)